MSDKSSSSSSAGIGFLSLFFIVLFVMKLGVGETVVEDWSWWWVTAPLWGPFAALAVVLAVVVACIIVYFVLKVIGQIFISSQAKKKKKKQERLLADGKRITDLVTERQRRR